MSLQSHVIERITKCKSNHLELTAGCGIIQSNIPELCDLLKKFPHINSLTLEGNGINNDDATLLAQILPLHIRSLDLTKTCISTAGAVALLTNKNLSRLILEGNNGITDAIVDAIEKADHLTFINLQYIHLTPPAVERIKVKVESNNARLHSETNETNKLPPRNCVIYSEPGYCKTTMGGLGKFAKFFPTEKLANTEEKESTQQTLFKRP